MFVYPKPDHEPAVFTVLNFPVDDVDAGGRPLDGSGGHLRALDGFDQDEKGVARADEGPAIAWFTDPAGNILSVLEEHVTELAIRLRGVVKRSARSPPSTASTSTCPRAPASACSPLSQPGDRILGALSRA